MENTIIYLTLWASVATGLLLIAILMIFIQRKQLFEHEDHIAELTRKQDIFLDPAGSEYADVQEERGYKYAAKMYSITGNLEKYYNDNDKEWYIKLKDSYLKGITDEYKRKYNN